MASLQLRLQLQLQLNLQLQLQQTQAQDHELEFSFFMRPNSPLRKKVMVKYGITKITFLRHLVEILGFL